MELLLAASLPIKHPTLLDHSRTILSAFIWAGSFIVGSAVFAQSTDSTSTSRLISTGQIEAARSALEAENPSEADRVFFEARVLKAQRRLPEAIKVFRQVLQIDPNYINARRELAHTLLLNRDYSPAQYHFDALLLVDQNDQMRDGYRRFLNVIDQNKPIGFSGYFSLLPSTNVNRGTTNTVFDTTLGQFVIDPNSQAESGVGAQLGVSGYFRHLTSPTSRIALNWSLSGTKYEEKRYNSAVGNTALSYEQITGSGRWFLSSYYRKTWREDNAGNDARGLRFGLTHRLNDQNQISFSLSHEYRDYAIQDYQDGTFSSASASISHQINPSLSISGGLGFERGSPEADHLQYNSSKLFLGLAKSWEGGLQTSFGFEYGQRDYVGVYPLTTSARYDDFYKISIGVQHSRIDVRGFTPQLSCSHTINQSNVAFFDYDATECQATISKNF
jgi:tetratricopeptide (TPR) repeat protein